ncbi:MAG: Dyp-type peroxidase [Blastocatellia bacterium]
MPVNLQLTNININPKSLNYTGDDYVSMLKDTQGNIVKGHGRDFTVDLFLQFNSANIAGVKNWIATKIAPLVTSGFNQLQAAQEFRSNGTDGGVFANFGLSADGYRALGFSDNQLPNDPSYLRGAKNPAPKNALGLNDPPVSQWQAGFQGTIHAYLELAGDDQAALTAQAQQIITGLTNIATVVDQENGAVFRNDKGQVIEHFGFTDGVSQPLFMADDIEAARMNGGLDVYDPSAPLGTVLLKDPMGSANGYGSYFVYRKLAQNVAGFRAQEAELATALGLSGDNAELAGAYIVGRFRDGTPVVSQPVEGWTNEPNNFNYDLDVDGLKCPFHAHTRKTNPRGDKVRQYGLAAGEDRMRRIARRAVSYGPLDLNPPAGTEVGLLFLCAQSSIVDQFEFIQGIWANFTQFLEPNTGLDPVIGQGAANDPVSPPAPQQWPQNWGIPNSPPNAAPGPGGKKAFNFSTWVTMMGGEYFFLPSISFLQTLQ